MASVPVQHCQQSVFSICMDQHSLAGEKLWYSPDLQAVEPIQQQNVTSASMLSPTTDNSKKESSPKGRYSNIEDGLESSLSVDSRNRINRVLTDIQQLPDVEKLLLYLRLPTGSVTEDTVRQTPPPCIHASNRAEQAQAWTWIRSHLEEDNEICLPKQQVYDDYRLYCENHNLRPLCTADFGKVMKCVFPNVKPRRLGQRGQSKYCYGGLRKKIDVEPPSLPELEIQAKKTEDETTEDDEIFTASCQLVCEWAQKLLGRGFGGVRELAEHLVGNLYVNSKSVAAFTVVAAMQDAGQASKASALFSTGGGDKHRETQLQLQRKLQERKLFTDQKRKIQQQREEVEQQLKMSNQDRVTPSDQCSFDRTTPQEFRTPKMKTPSPALSLLSPTRKNSVSRLRPEKQRSESEGESTEIRSNTPHERSRSLAGNTLPSPSPENLIKDKNTGLVFCSSRELGPSAVSHSEHIPSNTAVKQLVVHNSQGGLLSDQTKILQAEDLYEKSAFMQSDISSSFTTITQGSDEQEAVELRTTESGSLNSHQGSAKVNTKEKQVEDVDHKNLSACRSESANSHNEAMEVFEDSDATMEIDDRSDEEFDPIMHQGIQKPSPMTFKLKKFPAVSSGEQDNFDNDKSGSSVEKSSNLQESDGFDVSDMSENENGRRSCENIKVGQEIGGQNLKIGQNVSDEGIDLHQNDFSVNITGRTNKKSCVSTEPNMLASSLNSGPNSQASGLTVEPDLIAVPCTKSSITGQHVENVSIKTLLAKDKNGSNLPKQVNNFEAVSHSGLFIQQQSVSARSAFVPFSQVQSRKEPSHGVQNQNVTSGIPFIIPSSNKLNENLSCSTANLENIPSSLSSGTVVLKNVLTDVNHGQLRGSNSSEPVMNVTLVPITPVTSSSDPFIQTSHSQVSIISSSQTYTSSVTSSFSSNEPVLSIQSSPVTQRAFRSKFTPIRPKASPTKPVSAMLKEQKPIDLPVYDKRPVAAILKEKRAREAQAELAKIQSNIQQTGRGVQFPHALSLTTAVDAGNLGTIPAANILKLPFSPTKGGNEVVFIVNPQQAVLGKSVNTLPVSGPQIIPTGPTPNSKSVFMEGSLPTQNVQIVSKPGIGTLAQPERTLLQQGNVCTTKNMSCSDTKVKSKINQNLNDSTKEDDIEIIEINAEEQEKDPSSSDEEFRQKLDLYFSETPVKMAKLNVTSPFRPDSACSVGRETPVRVVRVSDNPQSRPESACSIGRETPSGGRKRKSSEISQRPNIKRLNSTGETEEIEEVEEMEVIQQERVDENLSRHVRRTKSCTIELDKGVSGQGFGVEPIQHQCPDITSVESDALIDSHSQFQIAQLNPQIAQKSSIGISAKSNRNSQQKLLKQKQDLDQRMKNFWKDDASKLQTVQPRLEYMETTAKSNVCGDRVNLEEPDMGVQGNMNRPVLMLHDQGLDLDSELPVDLAEFIMEKQRSDVPVADCGLDTLRKDLQSEFESVDMGMNENSLLPVSSAQSTPCHSTVPMSDSGVFTVPKPPPVSRFRDGSSNSRVSSNPQSVQNVAVDHQRSASLPSFRSPVRSPIIPGSEKLRVQRALSMSPHGLEKSPEREVVMSPVLKVTSPPKTVPEFQKLTNIQNLASTKARFQQIPPSPQKPSLEINHSIQGSNEVSSLSSQIHGAMRSTPYLDSMRHSLQKPRDLPIDKSSTQVFISSSPIQRNPQSRESSIERLNAQTPFSDPGYHSIDTSPVMNSTPVSYLENDSAVVSSNSSLQSQASMRSDSMRSDSAQSLPPETVNQSPIPVLSPQQAMSRPQFIMMSPGKPLGVTNLASPMEIVDPSSFMPIQGSQHGIRYVTPIRPMVTIANNNQINIPQKVINTNTSQSPNSGTMVVSPTDQNPPSYEIAVKSLRDTRPGEVCTNFSSSPGKMAQNGPVHTDPALPCVPVSNVVLKSPVQAPICSPRHQLETEVTMEAQKGQEYPCSASALLVSLGKKHIGQKSDSVKSRDKRLKSKQVLSGMCRSVSADSNLGGAVTARHLSLDDKPETDHSLVHHMNSLPSPVNSIAHRAKNIVNIPAQTDPVLSHVASPPLGDLPSMLPSSNFMGNAPNVDVRDILIGDRGLQKEGENRKEFLIKRNITALIDENELQTTLEDLQSFDSQYFTQADFGEESPQNKADFSDFDMFEL